MHKTNITALAVRLRKFVESVDRKEAFKDWTAYDLESGFIDGFYKGTTLYTTDEENNINGVILAVETDSTIHVKGVICKGRYSLYNFFAIFMDRWPTKKLSARRNGKFKLYNTVSFSRQIQRISKD